MSSWACQTGNVSDGTCTTTTPGASFTVPITVNLYAVAGTATAPVPGVALAAKTIVQHPVPPNVHPRPVQRG